MKTISDFKIENGVAILEGVSYAEEAKVVDEFLKNNMNVQKTSVVTKDNRYFELKNGKLIFTNEKTFLNPYYVKDKEDIKEEKTIILSNDNEKRLNDLENKINEIQKGIFDIFNILGSVVKKNQ